eukprot:1161413-Pelagomonas_calceolata.AAC.4
MSRTSEGSLTSDAGKLAKPVLPDTEGGLKAGRPSTAFQNIPTNFYRTSHCLSRPSDTAGLSKSFVWEAGQSFRAGGVLGGPGRQVYTLPKTGKHRAPAP